MFVDRRGAGDGRATRSKRDLGRRRASVNGGRVSRRGTDASPGSGRGGSTTKRGTNGPCPKPVGIVQIGAGLPAGSAPDRARSDGRAGAWVNESVMDQWHADLESG
jgi:hypothetical protein